MSDIHSISFCCGRKTSVTDSRPLSSGGIYRRRMCQVCRRRFKTVETFTQALSEPTAPQKHNPKQQT